MGVVAAGAVVTIMTGGATAIAASAAAAGTTAGTAAGTAAAATAGTAATTGVAAAALNTVTTAVASAATGCGATTVTAVASGPVGWLVLGAEASNRTDGITYDCWKPVLHDDSIEPSQGKLLKDVIQDPRIKRVELGVENSAITLVNVWDEKFELSCFTVPWSGQVVLHATQTIR